MNTFKNWKQLKSSAGYDFCCREERHHPRSGSRTGKDPPTADSLSGINTRTGELKQHWATDSKIIPEQQAGQYVTELNNNKEYASFVNDGHRMDKHFVPGLYVNPASGLLEYDPSRKDEVGIMVGTQTQYVEGLHMTDAAQQAYEETLQAELERTGRELERILR